jgi:hypothetical protein
MIKIKVDRALQEVWDWKDEIYRLNKGKSVSDVVKFIRREASFFRSRRKLPPKKGK